MQIMQISSLTMHDTKMYEAESDSMGKKWPRINHKINDWLINQISTGIPLPKIAKKALLLLSPSYNAFVRQYLTHSYNYS